MIGSCSALFFVVRGDSARIPKDMVDRGFGPDKNRWYIERWEDQTVGGGGAGGLTAGGGDARVLLQRALAASLSGGGAGGPGGAARDRAPRATGAQSSQVWQVTWGWVKNLYNR